MGDSPDMFGGEPEDEADGLDTGPSSHELEAAGQSSMFGEPASLGVQPPPSPERTDASGAVSTTAMPVAQPYRVLARKYRSQTFAELIGQDAMVQTLANAIKRDRLAHAFLMTGVRGVGKTSTARLIAKALNCIGPDGQGGPTIDSCNVCEPCRAISEGRHIDVIEMDAASNRGIDTVRELTEAVRYATVSARYKVYIIDEVHMMTKEAFNALLKTLEEPPAHVKFLFATTEVNALPVTVLSRCQRFDLKRIPPDLLVSHFAMICEKEKVEAEQEALGMIAAAAEGSVRDGLSILDQAISHADLVGSDDGATRVSAEQVRSMLGLADKTMQRRLLDAVLTGKGGTVLEEVAQQYALGIEPIAMMRAQMDVVHRVTVAQIGGVGPDVRSTEEREALEAWAKTLSAGQLHRLWQLLIKGYEEVKTAPDPLVAAQMALLRVMHAADMPDPGGLVRKLEELSSRPAVMVQASGDGGVHTGASMQAPMVQKLDWLALVEQVEQVSPLVGSTMRLGVRVVDLQPGLLRYQVVPGLPGDPAGDIRRALNQVTGQAWQLEIAEGEAQPSLEEAKAAKVAAEAEAMRQDPLVKAALDAFPGAQIVDEERSAEHEKRPWSKRA